MVVILLGCSCLAGNFSCDFMCFKEKLTISKLAQWNKLVVRQNTDYVTLTPTPTLVTTAMVRVLIHGSSDGICCICSSSNSNSHDHKRMHNTTHPIEIRCFDSGIRVPGTSRTPGAAPRSPRSSVAAWWWEGTRTGPPSGSYPTGCGAWTGEA